jgi:hypothetical protein
MGGNCDSEKCRVQMRNARGREISHIRRPTHLQEQMRRKKSACSVRNDGGGGGGRQQLKQH